MSNLSSSMFQILQTVTRKQAGRVALCFFHPTAFTKHMLAGAKVRNKATDTIAAGSIFWAFSCCSQSTCCTGLCLLQWSRHIVNLLVLLPEEDVSEHFGPKCWCLIISSSYLILSIPQLWGSLGHHRWFHNQFPPFFPLLHCPLELGELQPVQSLMLSSHLYLSNLSSSPFQGWKGWGVRVDTYMHKQSL